VRNALRQTERLIRGDESAVYWRVVDLRHESPATVVLEEVDVQAKGGYDPSNPPPHVVDEFIRAISAISLKATLPDHEPRDLALLEAYRDIATAAERNIERLTIQSGKKRVAITERFKENVERIIGPDELVAGSVNGVLEAINIHNTLRFNVYPLAGPKKVTCAFPPDLKLEQNRGLGIHSD
jgi:hypothetical protein